MATEDEDYIARDRKSNSSIVWFAPNQTIAYCSISIVNDTSYESSELFFVQLGNTLGNAIANMSTFPACVFINSDRNDGEWIHLLFNLPCKKTCTMVLCGTMQLNSQYK